MTNTRSWACRPTEVRVTSIKFAAILRPDGISYELDGALDKRLRDTEIFTSDFSTRQERIFTEKMEDLLGPRRLRGQPLDQRFTDIAASGQKQLEIVTTAGDALRHRGLGLRRRLPRRRRRVELQDEHGNRGRTVGRAGSTFRRYRTTPAWRSARR